jgi:hypothetical protein
MATTYRVTLTFRQLLSATDMLRYDGAFNIERSRAPTVEADDQFVIESLHFTEGRWDSFNVHPLAVETVTVKESDFKLRLAQANGFVAALRLGQELAAQMESGRLGKFWVEGGL